MHHKDNVLFLGTSSSMGVPVIQCHCPVCSSSAPYNKRLRPSVLLQIKDKKILIDVSPDFYQQALKYNIKDIDGLLLTHCHYDHVGGIDDLRMANIVAKRTTPCLLSKDSLERLQQQYDYIFYSKEELKTSLAEFVFHKLPENFGEYKFLDLDVKYFSYQQDATKVSGFRIGNFAYVTDIRNYSEQIFDFLQDLDVLVLSAVRKSPSPVHFSIGEALLFIDKIKPKKTYFTHISHDVDYGKMSTELPCGVLLAYDGLKVTI